VASLQPAVQRWPANAKVHAALGYALSNAGKNQPAVAELQEAIRLDFSLVEERYNLAVALVALGQRDAARAAAQKSLELRPDYTDSMVLLSVLALEDGDVLVAESAVNPLYALKPEDPKCQSLYCRLQLLKGTKAEQAGKLDEAEKSYRSGLAVLPAYWRLIRAEGILSLRLSHFPAAIENFRSYVQVQPEETEAYYLLGEALQKSGQADEGRKVLQQGLTLEQKKGSNANKVEAFKRALEQ
jgi:Flp pilus assembly protein TadD